MSGDAAYIVNIETFLSYFKGYKIELQPQIPEGEQVHFFKLFFADQLE